MIPKPTTADQARQNAILAAEMAEAHAGSRNIPQPSAYAAISEAWSAIAATFIETEMYASDELNGPSEKFEEWTRFQIGKLNNLVQETLTRMSQMQYGTATPEEVTTDYINDYARKGVSDKTGEFTIDQVVRAAVIRDLMNADEDDEPIIVSTRDLQRTADRSLQMEYNVRTGWELYLGKDSDDPT